jgi:hypothetical protein
MVEGGILKTSPEVVVKLLSELSQKISEREFGSA